MALESSPERFDAALAELAGLAIVSIGAFVDENARPAPRGVVTIADVELSDPPEHDGR